MPNNFIKINRNFCVWNPFTVRKQNRTVRTLKDGLGRNVVQIKTSSVFPHDNDDLIFFSFLFLENSNHTRLEFDSVSHFCDLTGLSIMRSRFVKSIQRLYDTSVKYFRWYSKNKEYLEFNQLRLLPSFRFIFSSVNTGRTTRYIRLSMDKNLLDLIKEPPFAIIDWEVLKNLSPLSRRFYCLSRAFPSGWNWDIKMMMERVGLDSVSERKPSKLKNMAEKSILEIKNLTKNELNYISFLNEKNGKFCVEKSR